MRVVVHPATETSAWNIMLDGGVWLACESEDDARRNAAKLRNVIGEVDVATEILTEITERKEQVESLLDEIWEYRQVLLTLMGRAEDLIYVLRGDISPATAEKCGCEMVALDDTLTRIFEKYFSKSRKSAPKYIE
jgi:hypothetical protein